MFVGSSISAFIFGCRLLGNTAHSGGALLVATNVSHVRVEESHFVSNHAKVSRDHHVISVVSFTIKPLLVASPDVGVCRRLEAQRCYKREAWLNCRIRCFTQTLRQIALTTLVSQTTVASCDARMKAVASRLALRVCRRRQRIQPRIFHFEVHNDQPLHR